MNALLTDLYELNHGGRLLEAGKLAERAVFELSIRRLPRTATSCGRRLPQVVDYLLNAAFTADESPTSVRSPQFQHVSTPSRLPAATSTSRAISSPFRRHAAFRGEPG